MASLKVIETTSTFPLFVKGMSAEFYEVANEADIAYTTAFTSALGVEKNKRTALWKERTSSKAKEQIHGKTGVSFLEYTAQGEDYKQDSRIPTYQTNFVFKKYTKGITVTEEEIDDRDYADKLDEWSDLNIGAKMTYDRSAFNLVNYLFTAQASVPVNTYGLSLYGDDLPGCSTVHTRADGGSTQSNASSDGIVLNDDDLETGRTALRNQLDNRGNPTAIGSGKLVLLTSERLEKKAVVLTNSEKRSEVFINDLNIYNGIVTVITTKWLNSSNNGSNTQWFLIDSLFAKMFFWMRKPLTKTRYIDNRTKNVTFDIATRYTTGLGDWRGIWGSKGDENPYSS